MANDYRKLKTGISGLDELFYGGICPPSSDSGTVILVRGSDSIYKLQFSIQLMHGLTKSIRGNGGSGNKDTGNITNPYYFSFMVDKKGITDICIDFQISNILQIIRDSERGIIHNNDVRTIKDKLHLLFDKGFGNHKNEIIPRLLDYSYYYNPRMHTVNSRIKDSGDGDGGKNCICARIEELVDPTHETYDFNGELIKVNICDGNDDDGAKAVKHLPAIQRFKTILSNIEDLNRKEKGKLPCLVIHGFSQFSREQLASLPISYMVEKIRSLSTVSILVLNDEEHSIPIDCDIIIDMRRNEDSGYVYHELKIRETAYQVATLGWHKYKLREYGIEVFPSLHRMVARRYYLSSAEFEAYKSIGYVSYSAYINSDTKWYNEDGNGIIEYETWINREKERGDFYLSSYNSLNVEKEFNAVIFDRLNPDYDRRIGQRRRKITAMIGETNSYSRSFVYARAFDSFIRCDGHTLILAFDKDNMDFRRNIRCPFNITGLSCKSTDCMKNRVNNCAYGCKTCYEMLHSFGIRLGNISPDELFYKIKRMLEWRFKDGLQIRNIIVDDMQKIEYCFPLLTKEQLFVPALIGLCKDRNIGIQFLCNDTSSYVRQLCSNVDETILFNRNLNKDNSVTISVFKSPELPRLCEYSHFRITDIAGLFYCDTAQKKISADVSKISIQ